MHETTASVLCWHKEIDDETGICKRCGARAAIKLEGLSKFPAKGRGSMGVRQDGNGASEAAKETKVTPASVETAKELLDLLEKAELELPLKVEVDTCRKCTEEGREGEYYIAGFQPGYHAMFYNKAEAELIAAAINAIPLLARKIAEERLEEALAWNALAQVQDLRAIDIHWCKQRIADLEKKVKP